MWRIIAKQIRKRDNDTCYKCNKYQQSISIHHILPREYLKKHDWLLKKYNLSSPDDKKNLISLCRSCHTKTDNDFKNLGITHYVILMLETALIREILIREITTTEKMQVI